MVRWLRESGLQAEAFKTEYGDEDVADRPAPDAAAQTEASDPASNVDEGGA